MGAFDTEYDKLNMLNNISRNFSETIATSTERPATGCLSQLHTCLCDCSSNEMDLCRTLPKNLIQENEFI